MYGEGSEPIRAADPDRSGGRAVTLGLSLLAGLLAGLYPSWRIGRTSPAVYLKNQ